MRFMLWRRPSAGPIWQCRSSGWRPTPGAIRFESVCPRPVATMTRSPGFWSDRRGACRVVQAPPPADTPPMEIKVQSLIRHDEAPHRGLTYRRLLRRLKVTISRNRTTVDLREHASLRRKAHPRLAAGALVGRTESRGRASLGPRCGQRRREIEKALREGELRAVVTSTSLELGVDIGTADVTVQVGLPGGVARCVQRVGRSGHRRGAGSRGLLLAATPAELAGAIITARAALAGRVEPLRMIRRSPRRGLPANCQHGLRGRTKC